MKLPSLAAAPLETRPGVPSVALLRAAAAWPETSRDGQLATVLKSAQQTPPRFVLLAAAADATTDSLPLAAVLAECLPGRTSVVTPPQVAGNLNPEDQSLLARELLLALESQMIAEGTLLAQAITPTRTDEATARFLAAGYALAGDLLYLGADLSLKIPHYLPGNLLSPLELIPHSPADFERWIPLLDHTYRHSLDCPAVDGLRPTRDVLIGYRDIGRPRDDWWFILRHSGRDVGCLLIADHSPAKHAELVYMGLVPEMRGRGWGVFLAQQARQIAVASGAEYLVLSVDAANTPALRHYQSAGFQFWEQRTILIKSLT